MSWLSVVQLNKPENVVFFEVAYPEKAAVSYNIWTSNNVIFSRTFNNPNEYVATFLYENEDHYITFQQEFDNTQPSLERWEYNDANNIVWTRIYLGPETDYTP
jgi:hypothetical protein